MRRLGPLAAGIIALLAERAALADDVTESAPAAPAATAPAAPLAPMPSPGSATATTAPPPPSLPPTTPPSSAEVATAVTSTTEPPRLFAPPPRVSPQYPARVVEPWSDADPPSPMVRNAFGEFGLRVGAEYRAQWLHVNNLSPTTETARNAEWLEHRLRTDATIDYQDKVKLIFSADMLDGTIWGDNGTLASGPAPNSGANINARSPNDTAACVTLRGTDSLDANAYGWGLCNGTPLRVRKAYGEVALPIGVLRVGRMNVIDGTGVQAADGDGRPNRFGMSRVGTLVDRALFATKPLEAFKAPGARDKSADRGVFAGVTYDRLVTDSPQAFGDDVAQVAASVRWLAPKHALGSDALVGAFYVHRWATGSRIDGFGLRAYSTFGPFRAGLDGAINTGTTNEISTAYQKISNDPPTDQPILQGGLRGVVRYDHRLFSLYLESDYASGSADPRARATLTQFLWAEDTNVGLLLFKHVLAFQTARAAAAGTELLRRLGATQFPTTALDTKGALTNAVTIFPQADFRPHPDLLLRGGVLFAWTSTPLINPVASLQNRQSSDYRDDLLNFAGGKPGTYYGTELDGRVQWRFLDHFVLDLEGAVLFPGSALENKDGYAVRSYLGQARTTFFF